MSEQVISKEKFAVVGKSRESMESISRPTLTFWQEAWRRIRKNKIVTVYFWEYCDWLCKRKTVMIEKIEGDIFTLKSNNTTGHIAGRLCYEHAEV